MSDSSTRPTVGQESTDPTATEDILDFLEAFQAYLDENLPRVRAACARIDARIKAEREQLGDEEDDAPDTDPEPPHAPGIAFLSDGRTALHVSHVGGAELHDRETWTGIILSHVEASDVLSRLSHAGDEAAGHVAGWILYGSKRKDEDDDGGAAQP
jgi:hypothetical protein